MARTTIWSSTIPAARSPSWKCGPGPIRPRGPAEVEYTYFDSYQHSADLGSDGDLVQVKTIALKTGGNPGTDQRLDRPLSNSTATAATGCSKPCMKTTPSRGWSPIGPTSTQPADILTKGDDDDNSGSAAHRIKDYASQQYTYYTTDVKTDNSGAGTAQDPKCVTVWAPSGENLQSKYGGTDADEVDSGTGKYLVKSVTVRRLRQLRRREWRHHERVLLPAVGSRHARQQ